MDTDERTEYRIEGFTDGRWHLLRPLPAHMADTMGGPEKNLTEVVDLLRANGMLRYTRVRIRRIVITESTTAEVTV